MSTNVLPAQPGLAWNFVRSPTLSTRVFQAVSARETRARNWPYPVWTFKGSYEFLRDMASDGFNELRTMEGFFLDRGGKFDAWLFSDPSDHQIRGGVIGTGDGATQDFTLVRFLGATGEPVGYVDVSNVFTFPSTAVDTAADAITLTRHGYATGDGPFRFSSSGALPTGMTTAANYWLIVVDANTFKVAVSKANALAGTQVDLTGAGSGTNTARKGFALYVNGTEQATSAYTVTAPRALHITAAPGGGAAITADFDFYYVCRFDQDAQDYNEFMDKLWELQQIEFRSLPGEDP